jgi:hypothetical protein
VEQLEALQIRALYIDHHHINGSVVLQQVKRLLAVFCCKHLNTPNNLSHQRKIFFVELDGEQLG